MDKIEKINVGVVLRTTLEEWREIEDLLGRHCDVVFVRKTPPNVRLRARQEFDKGEIEDGVKSRETY